MNLQDALRNIPYEYREYFKFKFPDVRYDKRIPPKTEEEFLKSVGRKTMNAFLAWEKTAEYKMLVALYLQTKIANDIYQIYEVVRKKALEGDEKSIKLLLQLNKEIKNIAQLSSDVMGESEEDEDDGLIV